nr:MAG TPA: hypothetical protein [Caudoviricetes sp.]
MRHTPRGRPSARFEPLRVRRRGSAVPVFRCCPSALGASHKGIG